MELSRDFQWVYLLSLCVCSLVLSAAVYVSVNVNSSYAAHGKHAVSRIVESEEQLCWRWCTMYPASHTNFEVLSKYEFIQCGAMYCILYSYRMMNGKNKTSLRSRARSFQVYNNKKRAHQKASKQPPKQYKEKVLYLRVRVCVCSRADRQTAIAKPSSTCSPSAQEN